MKGFGFKVYKDLAGTYIAVILESDTCSWHEIFQHGFFRLVLGVWG